MDRRREDFLESEPRRAAGAPVRPGLIDGPAAAAVDLLGEVLPGLSHCLLGQGDQVEVIDGDRGAGKPALRG